MSSSTFAAVESKSEDEDLNYEAYLQQRLGDVWDLLDTDRRAMLVRNAVQHREFMIMARRGRISETSPKVRLETRAYQEGERSLPASSVGEAPL